MNELPHHFPPTSITLARASSPPTALLLISLQIANAVTVAIVDQKQKLIKLFQTSLSLPGHFKVARLSWQWTINQSQSI
jgi:hypothetical protein